MRFHIFSCSVPNSPVVLNFNDIPYYKVHYLTKLGQRKNRFEFRSEQSVLIYFRTFGQMIRQMTSYYLLSGVMDFDFGITTNVSSSTYSTLNRNRTSIIHGMQRIVNIHNTRTWLDEYNPSNNFQKLLVKLGNLWQIFNLNCFIWYPVSLLINSNLNKA